MAQIEMVMRMQSGSGSDMSWPRAERLTDATFDPETGEVHIYLETDATTDNVDGGRLCRTRQGCMDHWHRRASATVHVRRLPDVVSTSAKHTPPRLPPATAFPSTMDP